MVHPDTAFEITVFPSGGGQPKSIITTRENFEEDFNSIKGTQNAAGCYVGLNPSSQNRGSRKRNTAETIKSRRHLVADIDGCKNGETPKARETLRTESIELAKKIAADLTAKGFPAPVIINSGNGAQMWYRISAETESDIVSRCLKALDARYRDAAPLHIDTGIGDAARIGRLPGTWNCKKDYPENEWRMAEIVSEPFLGTLDEVPHTCLEELAKDIPSTGAGNSSAAKEVEGLEYDTEENRNAFRRYLNTREGGVEGERGRGNLLETARFGGDFGLSPAAVVDELTTYKRAGDGTTYNERCEPPWDISEMETVVASSYKGRKESVGCKSPEYKTRRGVESFEALPQGESNGETAGVTTGESDAAWRAKFFEDFDALFYGKPAPPLGFLVHNFLYSEHDLTVWGGAGGAGKTTLTTQLQLALTQGGCFPLPPEGEDAAAPPDMIVSTELGGVDIKAMFVATEDPRNAHHRRYEKQTKAYPIRIRGRRKLVDLMHRKLDLFAFDRQAGKVKGGADWGKFVKNVIQEGINFVIFDNASNLMPGNENDRNDVSGFCSLFRENLCKHGVKVIMLAHTNKAGELSGSTGWKTGATEVIMTTTKGVGENRRFKTWISKDNAGPLEGTCLYTKFDRDTGCHRAVTEDEYNQAEGVTVDESELEEARRAITKRLQEQADKKARGDAKEDGVSEQALKRIPRGGDAEWTKGAIQNAINNMLFDDEVEEVEVTTKRTTKEDIGKKITGYRLKTHTHSLI